MTAGKTKQASVIQDNPGDFVLDEFVPYYFNRITNRLNKELADALRTIDMTISQWRVVAVLKERDGQTLTELSVYTITDQSTLSRAVDRMEESGLVEKRPRPDDGRFVEIFLTPHGTEMFHKIWPVAAAQYREAIAGIEQAELDAFVGTLRKILENIRRTPFE
jgi:DNA-binding MarR family transcriptional regulator